eukprot:9018429-Lingulodinium_polyedra.AAC.1
MSTRACGAFRPKLAATSLVTWDPRPPFACALTSTLRAFSASAGLRRGACGIGYPLLVGNR